MLDRSPGPAQLDDGLIPFEVQLRSGVGVGGVDPAAIPDDEQIGARPDRVAQAGIGAEISRHAVILAVQGQDEIGRESEDRLLLPELLDEPLNLSLPELLDESLIPP